MADAEKALGNEQFKAGNFPKAIEHFSKAINLEANHVLYSNRSACYCSLRQYQEALDDAQKCIEMKGDWGKGYGRKGAALHGLGRFDQAVAAYEKGLDVEPGLAMLTKGLEDAKRESEKATPGGMGGIGNVFAAPDVISKIASNPQTASFLADPTFMMKINELQRNPNSISNHLSDPRIMQVMGMLMGVNIQTPDTMGDAFGGASAPPSEPPKKKEPEPEPEVELTRSLAAKKTRAQGCGRSHRRSSRGGGGSSIRSAQGAALSQRVRRQRVRGLMTTIRFIGPDLPADIKVTVELSWTISQLKDAALSQWPAGACAPPTKEQLRVIHIGRFLTDEKHLKDFRLPEGDTTAMHLIIKAQDTAKPDAPSSGDEKTPKCTCLIC